MSLTGKKTNAEFWKEKNPCWVLFTVITVNSGWLAGCSEGGYPHDAGLVANSHRESNTLDGETGDIKSVRFGDFIAMKIEFIAWIPMFQMTMLPPSLKLKMQPAWSSETLASIHHII
jgi:hypothetical protein